MNGDGNLGASRESDKDELHDRGVGWRTGRGSDVRGAVIVGLRLFEPAFAEGLDGAEEGAAALTVHRGREEGGGVGGAP